MRTGAAGRHLPSVSIAGAVLGVLLLFLAPLAPTGAAPVSQTPSLQAQEGRREGSMGAAAIGGVVGGTVGFFTGALVGSSADCSTLCAEIFAGALIGETVGLALGAHVFNGARGSLAADFGVSAGIMLAGIGLTALDSGDEFILAAMVGQVIGVAITEVRTSPWIEPTTSWRRTPEGLAMEIGFSVR